MTLYTIDEAIEKIRNTPGTEKSVLQNYFDRDVVHSAERFADSSEFQEVLKLLINHRPPAKVLDLGAGRGIASYAFVKAGYQVTALEPDSSEVVGLGALRELALRSGIQIETIESEGESISVADASYDIVYVRQVLHHVRDLQRLCREVFRILKPNGVFLVTREHVISKQEDLPIFLNNHLVHYMAGGENAFQAEIYVNAIKLAGLRLDRVWGSYDSLINYYPRSLSDLKNECSILLKPYIPARIFRPFLNIPFIFNRCKKFLSDCDQTPGRMYSFLATKR